MPKPQPHYEPENYDALRRAVAVSQWNLGSESWAHMILDAYFDPDDADAAEAIDELSETVDRG
jgi:hypothetical protein